MVRRCDSNITKATASDITGTKKVDENRAMLCTLTVIHTSKGPIAVKEKVLDTTKNDTAHLKIMNFLCRVCRQTNPFDLFLFLRDNIHSHKDIKSIVYTPPNVLLVILKQI